MQESYRGKFIVLEGLDGAGTTTQTSRLAKYLFEREKRNTVLLTREPTSLNPYGLELRRRLRNDLLSGEEVIHDPQYWADLFVNDRRWHLDNYVVPAVSKGQHVISDRHKLSTLAYQSVSGRSHIDMDSLVRMHAEFYVPDLTLYLDISATVGWSRIRARDAPPDGTVDAEYFEKEDFLTRVQEQYLLAVTKFPEENIVVIDGSKPIDEVSELIRFEVNKLFGYEERRAA